MEAKAFIDSLPKAELHLHFEGTLPWALIKAHVAELLPESPPWGVDGFLFDDFTQFSQVMRLCFRNVLTSLANYHAAARAIFKNLAAQNVRYVETSFSPEHVIRQALPLNEVISAIKEAAPAGLAVAVFCGLGRQTLRPLTDPVIEALFKTPNLDGLDLHGDERLQGPAPFADIYTQARRHGLLTKAHAGELVGPESITEALNFLKVTRIEHGTTAIQDEALMTRLAAEKITLDMSPWSNVKLRVVDDIAGHPIRQFHERGIPVTINTDDPTIFGYSLTDEITSLLENHHFSLADLAQLQVNAFRVAKLPEGRRKAILTEIDQLVAQATAG